jgi:hypothetical protein
MKLFACGIARGFGVWSAYRTSRATLRRAKGLVNREHSIAVVTRV